MENDKKSLNDLEIASQRIAKQFFRCRLSFHAEELAWDHVCGVVGIQKITPDKVYLDLKVRYGVVVFNPFMRQLSRGTVFTIEYDRNEEKFYLIRIKPRPEYEPYRLDELWVYDEHHDGSSEKFKEYMKANFPPSVND